VACEVTHIPDKEQIYSCDTECFKVIESKELLEKHMEDHRKIKMEGVKKIAL
jgi:hypothetical protein